VGVAYGWVSETFTWNFEDGGWRRRARLFIWPAVWGVTGGGVASSMLGGPICPHRASSGGAPSQAYLVLRYSDKERQGKLGRVASVATRKPTVVQYGALKGRLIVVRFRVVRWHSQSKPQSCSRYFETNHRVPGPADRRRGGSSIASRLFRRQMHRPMLDPHASSSRVTGRMIGLIE
jgi:hypothetical protein